MDFARSFSFITEDKDWFKKVGIAAILIITGIGGIVVLGWVIEIVKRVGNDDPEPLPGWENIGDYAINGIKYLGVGFVWSLPIIFLTICSSILIFSSSDCYNGYCPFDAVATIAMICMSFFVLIYSLVVGLLLAPTFGLIASEKSFGELLNPKTSFNLLKLNFGGYAVAFIAGSIISGILSTIGIIACFVGTFFGGAFGYAVMGSLVGQAHKKAVERLDVVIPDAE